MLTPPQRHRLDSAVGTLKNSDPPVEDEEISGYIYELAKDFDVDKSVIDKYLSENKFPVL